MIVRERGSIWLLGALAAAVMAITACSGDGAEAGVQAAEVDLSMARFFGDCDDTTEGVTDVSEATTECEVIQILTNKYNAENDRGITISRLGGAEWGSYYDALNTSFAGGNPPDIAVMHGSNLPDYTSRNLIQPIGEYFGEYDISAQDWTDPAHDSVAVDGDYYGVAFDLHANLFHVNVDLFREAGLVDENDNPILPGSRAEFFEQAEQVRETTGAWYFTTDASQFPIGVRQMFTLVWQQGSDLVSADGTQATVDTPEAREAVEFMVEMFEQGYANPEYNYTSAESAFLSGEAAILLNGTWAVDQYNRQADFDYRAMDFPTLYDRPAVWANSHIWVLPVQRRDEKYEHAIDFLAFLHERVGDWAAGTGHLAPRTSVLMGPELQEVAQRSNYAETANIAQPVPAIQNWQAVEDILKEEIEATWLTGKSIDAALADADRRINNALR